MADQTLMSCSEGAILNHDGSEVVLHLGQLAHRGHPIVRNHPELWRPATVLYPVPDDEDDPRKPSRQAAPKSAVRADQAGARSR